MIQAIVETTKRIREHIKGAQSWQKSYADKRRRLLEFQVGNKVFLKVSPIKGIKRFGMRGKLSSRHIGPYEIIEQLNPTAYHLDLPPELEHVHNVFHISQLRKYILDSDDTIVSKPIKITGDLIYEERPIQMLGHRTKQLRNK